MFPLDVGILNLVLLIPNRNLNLTVRHQFSCFILQYPVGTPVFCVFGGFTPKYNITSYYGTNA